MEDIRKVPQKYTRKDLEGYWGWIVRLLHEGHTMILGDIRKGCSGNTGKVE